MVLKYSLIIMNPILSIVPSCELNLSSLLELHLTVEMHYYYYYYYYYYYCILKFSLFRTVVM